jgi:hypothetical protein
MSKTIHLVGYAKQHSHYTDPLYQPFRQKVLLDGEELDPNPSLILRSHSPSGFGWGFQGPACSQLALAICLELYTPTVALEVYYSFREKHLLSLPYGQDFNVQLNIADIDALAVVAQTNASAV